MKYEHRFRVRAPSSAVADFHARSSSMAAITPPFIPLQMLQAPQRLAAGDTNSISIDDDNIVAGIHVRRILRLMFTTQTPRDFAGEPPQGFAGGIDNKPVAPDFVRFGTEGFHFGICSETRVKLQKSGNSTERPLVIQAGYFIAATGILPSRGIPSIPGHKKRRD